MDVLSDVDAKNVTQRNVQNDATMVITRSTDIIVELSADANVARMHRVHQNESVNMDTRPNTVINVESAVNVNYHPANNQRR